MSASTPAPSLGRIVHFTVDQNQAEAINKRRLDFHKHRSTNEAYTDTGYVAHTGNEVRAGDVFAATIVRVWPGDLVNLQVHLDGTDTYWATSAAEGDQPGSWFWPPRV
ncbi:hypothetical protein PP499_gp19 [Gordonia phage Bjanes7]|uniref:Uncharacterized protein n=5 Tax=Attisvirus TaxID=2169652 RepID=A0A142K8R1_9CAUD|nr:hypothetical protein SEA_SOILASSASSIN_19 [Gordonia phage SoilAssassin]YP_009595777.1 lysin A [Gordonia phage Attis]YP_010653592.1 hypothetical protein PP496_gp19 [Gordonia phage Yeet412]YP_010653808.1 hypothetical protein PP499_gp19 [Gordonia phage Bjanes7]QDF18339.1 hypothetical protein SEA_LORDFARQUAAD_19 [Gordonia phage LordFarquaad]AMS02420.1 hypothetical protein SEA_SOILASSASSIN_19 [Gordonia phage SoilAssassin]AMS02494.1 hypothetical protein SEA_ATTIS_19 [Gordonia phage Attis]ATW6071